VIRGLTNRAVSSTAARLPGADQAKTSPDQIQSLLASDEPMPMNPGLKGREVSVFISGHTHMPSMTELARDGADKTVVVNTGCWLRQLWPVRAHLGAPAVFVSTLVLTHVRVYLDQSGVRVELWEHPKPAQAPRRLRLAQKIAVLGRLPASPAADAKPRIVASTGLTKATSTRSLVISA
jgi:hypothetical protein